MCDSDDECLLCFFHRTTEFHLKCAPTSASFENWKFRSEGLFSTELSPSSKQYNEELSNLISLDNCSQVQCAWDAATVRPVVKVNHERILAFVSTKSACRVIEESALATTTTTSTICGILMTAVRGRRLQNDF